jgi:lysophospholipase L1-like esterase
MGKVQAVFPNHQNKYEVTNYNLGVKDRKRVILFGDSRVAQWINMPNINSVEFINRGIAGETSAQLLQRVEHDLLALDPDIVILQFGINDLVAAGLAPELELKIVNQLKDNFRQIVDILVAEDIKVALLSIIPPSSPPLYRKPFWSSRIPRLVIEVNEWLNNFSLVPGVVIVNPQNVLLSQQNGGKDLYKDTLHLSDKSYLLLNMMIKQAIL